jgi:3-isopropylmalate dehydrogenase
MAHRVAVLPGDGIGPEVVAEAAKVLKASGVEIEFEEALVGGAAYDDCGHPLPSSTLELCRAADAVLFGAIGGPKWDDVNPPSLRPEIGALLPLRAGLGLYANIRPARTFRALTSASPLKLDRGLVDLVVVRELTGGIYFGKPRGRRDYGETALDTCVYSRREVERITVRAFEIARARSGRVVSVDKANVLETSRLWREVVAELARANPELAVTHMLVDNCAMQLVRNAAQFDVILTENMFGDILSDEASMITGSLGMLPSASLGDEMTPRRGQGSGREAASRAFGLYEPIHGSAPDIAGQGRANPLAAILSGAMMLRHSLCEPEAAARVETAVEEVLNEGLRTPDIFTEGCTLVSTRAMGDVVAERLQVTSQAAVEPLERKSPDSLSASEPPDSRS